jgi:predicted nucleic acid-binding protein
MRVLVLDTSVLVSAHHEGEAHHAKARSFLESLPGGGWDAILLHEYVFLELVTVLAVRRSFARAVEAGEALLAANGIEFVASSEDFLAVWQAFRSQGRGKLSFADSALVALGKARNATHLATFDKDLLKAAGLADAIARA